MHVKPEGKQNKNVPEDGRAQLTKGPVTRPGAQEWTKES